MVWVRERGVLIAGDLVTLPIPAAADGYSSITGWLEAVEQVQAGNTDVVVPGHGAWEGGRQALSTTAALLRSIVDQVQAGRDRGATLSELEATVDVGSAVEHAALDARTLAALQALFVTPAVAIAFRELDEVGH